MLQLYKPFLYTTGHITQARINTEVLLTIIPEKIDAEKLSSPFKILH